MEHRGGSLSGSLELASAFSSQINAGVPVEIVEAENQPNAVLSSENGAQNIAAEDAMEISVEGDAQGLDSTQLSNAPRTVELPMPSEQAAASSVVDMAVPAMTGMIMSSETPSSQSSSAQAQLEMNIASSVSTNTAVSSTQSHSSLLSSTTFPSSLTSSQSMLVNASNPHSSQLTRTVMEQLTDAQGLEMPANAVTSVSIPDISGNYQMPQMSYSTPTNSLMASRGRELLSGSVNYSDLELSVGGNASNIDTSGVLNDPESPSSPESNFDSSELLSNPLTHQDEVTQRLAQSGPIGVAAAAAIMSSNRKRKRQHMFETNPSFRKRHCSKLTKKLKETIEELTARVGLQSVVVMYRPGKGNGKNEPSFKVFGAAPLVTIVKNQRNAIVNEMEAALHDQAPTITTPPTTQQGEPLFDLPPLVFEGIPTPVHKMTQAQLRTFIPNMLKYSTGRGKPGWGKDDVRPVWWPDDVPWANVRSDIRDPKQKKALQWTDALRRIVINCYLHHGRMDLLPEFSIDQLQQYLTPQVAQQLQVSLDNLQQQQGSSGSGEITMGTTASAGASVDSAADEVAAALNEITEASGGVEGRDDPEMMVGGDNQQVFTVDTGLGDCDMTGMPTLADASLAETAARLQQLADETGEVQYATQTVTVTDRDAKALGQPVGSTTTVLLTAYPGGHSGATGSTVGTTSSGEQLSNPSPEVGSPQFLTSQPNAASNVQVVYSASHIDPLLPPPSTEGNVGGSNEEDSSNDLAAQLIREYSMGGDGGKEISDPLSTAMASNRKDMPNPMTTPMASESSKTDPVTTTMANEPNAKSTKSPES